MRAKTINESLRDKLDGPTKEDIISKLNYDENVEFKPTKKESGGTSLIGYYTTSYKELESIFGKPQIYIGYNKQSYEWVIIDNNQNILTIYDYKTKDDVKYMPSYKWHIGGYHNAPKNIIDNLIYFIYKNKY